MYSLRVLSSAIALVLFVAGCGDGGLPKLYPVTGKVTLKGEPLASYTVSFVPTKGEGGASATTGVDGTFSLESLDGRPGCQIGNYKVVIMPGGDAMQAMMKDLAKNMKPGPKGGPPKFNSKVPEAYSSASTSPKSVEVKAEPNVVELSL